MLRPEHARRLEPYLRELLVTFDTQRRVAIDPIEFPRRYRRREDIEVAALLAACLAYGRVDLFRPKLEALFAESQIGRSGLVNAADLQHALELTTRGGDPQSWKPLMRAITLELWLKTNPTFSEGGYELTQANTGSPASSPGRRNPRFKR